MKILIVTTVKDHSINDLLSSAGRFGIDALCVFYDQPVFELEKVLRSVDCDVVYFRDPFNVGSYSESAVKELIDYIKDRYSSALYIDDAKSYDDLLIEDKWRQYDILREYMPETKLLNNPSEFEEGNHIAKERLSSRGRGIAFSRESIQDGKRYIVQPLLKINKEYRIFCVNGEIVDLAAVRSSKTINSKVKMLQTETIVGDLLAFADNVYRKVPQFHLIGLDVAVLEDGSFVLLEINRSPQFSRYNQITGKSLADELMKGLLQ